MEGIHIPGTKGTQDKADTPAFVGGNPYMAEVLGSLVPELEVGTQDMLDTGGRQDEIKAPLPGLSAMRLKHARGE